MANQNRQVLLRQRPKGMPTTADFEIADMPLPDPAEGEVLVRGIYLSLDPYMRGRISGARSYAKPVDIGAVMEGRVVGEVQHSRDPSFGAGDYVYGGYGWQLVLRGSGQEPDKTRSGRGAAVDSPGRAGHAGTDRLCRVERDRPAATGRNRRRLGRLGGGGCGRRPACQARRCACRRHCRRHRQMPLCRNRARLRRLDRPPRGRSRRRTRPGLPQRHRRLFRECRGCGAAGGVCAAQRFRRG